MATQVDAATLRHQLIADQLETVGRVEVVDLADRLNVAPETVRRDLRLLEQQGLLQRVHGGAVRRTERPWSPFTGMTPEPPENIRRLADVVVSRFPDHGSVFLGVSPLITAVAQSLAGRTPPSPGLTIVTTSLDVAVLLSRVDCLTVLNIGGQVDHATRAQEGDWALSEIQRLRLDLALLPSSGVIVDGRIYGGSPMAGAVMAAAIEVAGRVWLLIETPALGRVGFLDAGSVDRLEHVFVTGVPDPALMAPFREAGIEVTAAP